jgi:membrane associated rhomboid family serine protease
VQSFPVPAAPRRPVNRVIPPHPLLAAMVMLAFVASLYAVELANVIAFHDTLSEYGIRPHAPSGLIGVLWAPLLHAGWAHLAANTVPVLLFGFLAMAGGIGQWVAITVTIWLISGVGVWLTADPRSTTVGASALAFGWLAFLLVRGLFNRSMKQIVVAAVLLFFYGGVLWGVLPGNPLVSWQGHLFGALAGVLAAWLAARASRPRLEGGGTSGPVLRPPR